MKEEKKHPGGIYLSDLAQQYFPGNTQRSAVSQLHDEGAAALCV